MDKTALYNTKKSLIAKNLGQALHHIQTLLEDRNYVGLHERIRKVSDDYRLMLDYMRQGYPDPSRSDVYLSLLRRLDRLTNEATLVMRALRDSRTGNYVSKASRETLPFPVIVQQLEDFVSEVALLGLSEDNTEERSKQIHNDHHELMSSLFERISFSRQWHSDDREFFEHLVLSPTIDTNDAALLVSAITLSSITYFDVHKYIALAHIYQGATEEPVRQRALVGWALTTTRTHALYPEVATLVGEMVSDKETSRLLLELQTQLFFCINAERDQAEISRDIMPNLMKNKGFDITRHGIVEKEDDPMQDILDPEASDRAMEELEHSFERMSEMQRNGSDIYFGGFSQMKRYPFFYTLSNWFCPFYSAHPGLAATQSKLEGNPFLDTLMSNGPFCDSDKYSFALALATVIDKIPENMRSALNDGASLGPTMPAEQLRSPSNIRLMYLQDLYRFFRLSDFRSCFYNPFGGDDSLNALFICNDILRGHIAEDDVLRLGNFLLRRSHFSALKKLLANSILSESANSHILTGYSLLHEGYTTEAQRHFGKAVELEPTNKRALSGYGRTSMLSGDFASAEQAYSQLSLLSPDNRNYALHHALSLIRNGKASEATPLLYKLSYEHEEDTDITRVLAWSLFASGKPAQAQKEYSRLLNSEQSKAEDHLNAGYCHWVSGEISAAVDCFRQYKKMTGDNAQIEEELSKDKDTLIANGITECELHMMQDLLEIED